MIASKLLLVAACALGLFSVGQVWLVQISSYPLWAFVGEREFKAYHAAWWRSIWFVILAPSALLAFAAALMLWWLPPNVPPWEVWAACALQTALILGTAVWWAPLMARLEAPSGGLVPERYALLMTSHWIRVAIVTAYGGLAIAMLLQSAWR
jgi:hypothetical protein